MPVFKLFFDQGWQFSNISLTKNVPPDFLAYVFHLPIVLAAFIKTLRF